MSHRVCFSSSHNENNRRRLSDKDNARIILSFRQSSVVEMRSEFLRNPYSVFSAKQIRHIASFRSALHELILIIKTKASTYSSKRICKCAFARKTISLFVQIYAQYGLIGNEKEEQK